MPSVCSAIATRTAPRPRACPARSVRATIARRVARLTDLVEQLTAQRAEERIGTEVEIFLLEEDFLGAIYLGEGRAAQQAPEVDGSSAWSAAPPVAGDRRSGSAPAGRRPRGRRPGDRIGTGGGRRPRWTRGPAARGSAMTSSSATTPGEPAMASSGRDAGDPTGPASNPASREAARKEAARRAAARAHALAPKMEPDPAAIAEPAGIGVVNIANALTVFRLRAGPRLPRADGVRRRWSRPGLAVRRHRGLRRRLPHRPHRR